VALLQAMGANATPIPYAEVYTALKTGVVDGAENNWPSYDTARHYEVAKYYAITDHSMAPEMLLMSKKVWDTLTPQEQAIIKDAAKQSVPYMRKLWDAKEAESRKKVETGGAQVVEVDKKSFADAMQPVYDKFITDPKLKDMVQKVKATQ
jgi:TRAP-type C4-dicarboxylate transport system substrate-binding protein